MPRFCEIPSWQHVTFRRLDDLRYLAVQGGKELYLLVLNPEAIA